MNRSESKYRNTANKMCQALVSLLETKEFTDISIMDICQKAGVYRSTFYSHYNNTYDLLKETRKHLENDFFAECTFDDPIDFSNLQNVDPSALNFITPKYLVPYLSYIKKHKHLFKIYGDNMPAFEANDIDQNIAETLFVPIFERYGVRDKRRMFYMQKYFLKGIDAIINEWVRNDCMDSVEYICEVITYCVRP